MTNSEVVLGSLGERYTLGTELGRGAYGVVFQALRQGTGDFVAAKRFNLHSLEEMEAEIGMLRRLHHQHIVKYFDTARGLGAHGSSEGEQTSQTILTPSDDKISLFPGGALEDSHHDSLAHYGKREQQKQKQKQGVEEEMRLNHEKRKKNMQLQRRDYSNIGNIPYCGYLYVILEYVEGGSLAGMMRKFGPFSESLVGLYINQVIV
jgi:serine/threonine protein kinase